MQYLSKISRTLGRTLTIKSTAGDIIVEVGPERKRLWGSRGTNTSTREDRQSKKEKDAAKEERARKIENDKAAQGTFLDTV